MTLLLLYKSGYLVGKYISIEKHIEKTKDAYYDVLEASSVGWHEEEDDPTIFVKYMLGVILACYREFESRVNIISDTTVVKLILKREPENRFDENAILVLDEQKRKLGYIPEKDNIVFARLMDAGKYLTAKVKSYEPKGAFRQINISIYLVDF